MPPTATATRVPPTATPLPPTATPTKTATPTPTPRPKGWVTIKTAHSPSPRTGFAMTMLRDGRVLMFGGQDKDGKKLNDTWVFGPAAKAQRQSPDINLSLALSAGLGAAFAPWLAPQSPNALQGGGEDWTQLNPANPPSPRSYPRITTLSDGTVWMFGGERQDGTLSSELFSLNPITTTLQYKLAPGNPPPARFSSAVFQANNQIYVHGGAAKRSDGQAYLIYDFWRYDPISATWTELPKAPGPITGNAYPVTFPSATGQVVNFVDVNAYPLTQGTNYYYDYVNNSWGQTRSQGVRPTGRYHYSVAGTGNTAILTGGLVYDANTKTSNPTPEVWTIDLKTGQWTRIGDAPFPLSDHGSVYDSKQDRMIVWASVGEGNMLQAVLLAGFLTP